MFLRLTYQVDIVTENELAKIVVNVGMHVHKTLGPGLLESVYQRVMAYELRKSGVTVEEEVALPVVWDDIQMDIGFRVDLFVNRKLIVELKSIQEIHPVHKKVLLTYLRLADCRLGLLLNFGAELMKSGISRVANGLADT